MIKKLGIEEINEKISAINKACRSNCKFIKRRHISRKIKLRLRTVAIGLIVILLPLYGSNMFDKNESNLRIFERRTLTKMFGSKKIEGEYRTL